MATKPFDLSEPDSISKPQLASIGARMVTGSINKYVNYLVKQADVDVSLLLKEVRHNTNNQFIELADMFYERIPEDQR